MPQQGRGECRFAEQIGGWVLFAQVEVVVEVGAAASVLIEAEGLSSDPRREDWLAGLHFGVRYALEKVPSSARHVSIRITDLHTNPVDSSTLSVAYATCLAVWDALGHKPNLPPHFDDGTKSFVFPG